MCEGYGGDDGRHKAAQNCDGGKWNSIFKMYKHPLNFVTGFDLKSVKCTDLCRDLLVMRIILL